MTDWNEREKALDTTNSYIVQAPAGSGKTELLISRYICLLATVSQPEEILAMTFTRKATAEMRSRVLEALDPESNVRLHSETARNATERVREKSQKLGWDLHNQPSRLQIKTIDSLTNELVRNMPWSSRYGAVPRFTDKLDEVLYAAAESTIESIQPNTEQSQAIARLLFALDNNADQLIELIVAMLKKRDQWIRILQENEFTFDDRARENIESVRRSFIQSLLDDLRDKFPKEARILLRLDELDHSILEGVGFWPGVAEDLLTKGGTWRKQVSKGLSFTGLSQAEIKHVISLCERVPRLNEELARFGSETPHLQFEDSQWELLQAIAVVLTFALAHLKIEFRKQGEVDFIEIAQQAAKALGTPEKPTDLMFVLDYRFKHILIDEFQDTSVTQLELIQSLIRGWQPDDGRTLFMVGDPMQSIYRFREAEVGIFLSVMENGIDHLVPHPLQLTQNFRSNHELVDWYNVVFEASFPKDPNRLRSEVSYAQSTSANDKLGSQAVHIQVQSSGPRLKVTLPIEAKSLVSDLKEYLERNRESDVRAAILLRARKHASDVIPLLRENNIKFFADQMFTLSDRLVIKDLLSLTRSLLKLDSRTDWLAVLRAPWCGLILDDLLTIATGKNLIWQSLNNESVLSRLSEDGRTRAVRVREVFRRAFSTRGQMELRQWVEDTWVLLGGPACVSPSDLQNAQLFLDRLELYSNGTGVENLNQFEQKLSGLYAVPECNLDEADVFVSTIHNAKGLEFDAVFLPSFNRSQGRSEESLIEWSEVVTETKRKLPFVLCPINRKGTDEKDALYDYIKNWNNDKDYQERIRLAYVACTRAKRELFIYSAVKWKQKDKNSNLSFNAYKGSLLECLLPGISASDSQYVSWFGFEEQEEAENRTEDQTSSLPTLARLPDNWVIPKAPDSLRFASQEFEAPGDWDSIKFEWAGNIAVWVGTVVHEWLNRITVTGLETWSIDRLKGERAKWRSQLQLLGLSPEDKQPMADALNRIETALTNVLSDQRGRWLLSSHHREANSEYRITGYIDGTFRNFALDRTFVDKENVRWIVDYKTGSTMGKTETFLDNEVLRYRSQLEDYKKAMEGFEPRPIRMGLYFPMFPAWREIS